MNNYVPTIGLEIHAELKTKTKMFCDSQNNPDETRPNVNVCPICMGHPGTLPTINKEAVRQVLRVGVAVGGTLADETEFSRKNYFYPDIPKGYQISQYAHPLVSAGTLHGVALTRIHLEEDTGISLHDRGDYSLLDFNRAGVPLLELVTEPVIHSGKDASLFARELQLLLRALSASDANMEKGEMRVEANISVNQNAEGKMQKLGTKVEVKNLNSFKAVERAIEYETKRQSVLLERGEGVTQETRGWNEQKQETFSQRAKEESHDYRYFPEPDLPTLRISLVPEFSTNALKKDLQELPSEKRTRYHFEGIPEAYIEMFIANPVFAALFEQASARVPQTKHIVANLIGTEIAGLVSQYGAGGLKHITPNGLAAVAEQYASGVLSSRGAKDALAETFQSGGDLADRLQKYKQQNDAATLTGVVRKVLAENSVAVADYKKGKQSALQYLVGACMKDMRGAGNPQLLRDLLFEEMLRG